jgi:GDPmannose 4,6-dehydratase
MWLMLQQPQADDFVIATGETHSVQELLQAAFACAGLDWKQYVETDPKLVRPAEVDYLCGDSTKARKLLGWKPEVNFGQLLKMMVEADLNAQKQSLTTRAVASGV